MHPELSVTLQVVDVAEQPAIALAAGVFVTPTVIRTIGADTLIAVGSLQDQDALLHLLSTGTASPNYP